MDRLRPAYAHRVVARLRDRGARSAHPCRKRRTRCDRNHRPQRLRGRSRSSGRDDEPDGDPWRGDQDPGPGRGDRPLPERGDPARPSVRGHTRRDPRTGRHRLSPPPLRSHALHPRCGNVAATPRRDRCLRGLQRASPLRGLQRRSAAFCPQVQPDDGRRLGRACAPGRRHGRAANARVPRPRRVPRQPPLGSGTTATEVAVVPSVAQAGGPGQGTGPLAENRPRALVPRTHRRDLREVPAKGHHRDQRARRRDLEGGRRPHSGAGFRASARRRLPAQAPAAGGGGAGRRRLLRPRGPGAAEVASAPSRRPACRLRDELPQVRRPARGRGQTLARARAPHRPAEAGRDHGRRGAGVPERAGVPARGYAGTEGRRAPALHADDRGAGRSRHRRFTRRATRQDTLLERVQTTGPLVGRVASLLGAPRVIAFGLLAVVLGLYYGFHTSLPNTSTWGDVAFLSFVLIPAVLALVYLGLPLRAARELELIAVAIAFAILAVILHEAGLNALSDFAKLGSMAFAA